MTTSIVPHGSCMLKQYHNNNVPPKPCSNYRGRYPNLIFCGEDPKPELLKPNGLGFGGLRPWGLGPETAEP